MESGKRAALKFLHLKEVRNGHRKTIVANRTKAKRSTGPRSAVGELSSSRNAYQHGLTCPLRFDRATSEQVMRAATFANITPRISTVGGRQVRTRARYLD